MFEMRGIDVSHWQGKIDFKKVKKNGFDFVIIKAGGADSGLYKDKRFEEYYEGAKKAGLYVGTYYFTGPRFCTSEEGEIEARHFLSLIEGKRFEMPIYCDVECVPIASGKDKITDAAISFCEFLESKNYFTGIYASEVSGFVARLEEDRIKRYTSWVAKYSKKFPAYPGQVDMWQYGGSINFLNTAKVEGVSSKECDQNFCYVNFPLIIEAQGFNGFEKTSEDVETEKNPGSIIKIGPMSTGDFLNVYKAVKAITEKLGNIKIEVSE